MIDGEKIILPDSPEAATWRTDIAGWVSRDGQFFGDGRGAEHLARMAGSTHACCDDCTLPIPRGRTWCGTCRETRAVERYRARESRPWDGKTPLYSEVADVYFFDEDELTDYCDAHECTPASLRLLLCEGHLLSIIDADDLGNELPDEAEIPDAVEAARLALNQAIRDAGPIWWSPGAYAATIGETS